MIRCIIPNAVEVQVSLKKVGGALTSGVSCTAFKMADANGKQGGSL